ncbi:MAG: hypothetical protein LUG98_09230, partial [Tannerellaceae bacterium]|nr:hypothetical protein [Tannerellaceae bacterium]
FLYDRGFNKKILSQKEKHSFDELNLVASRFSEFEEEHKLDPFAFSTEEDVYNQIVKCYNDLISSI